jgi:adenine phosphoribosyltransferase
MLATPRDRWPGLRTPLHHPQQAAPRKRVGWEEWLISSTPTGFEARGLIFGAPLALALKCAFVPLRKPGKLPGETISESYNLEYGSDQIEMHVGAVKEGQNVLLVDDLIATGGTMEAGLKLMRAHSCLRRALCRVAQLCTVLTLVLCDHSITFATRRLHCATDFLLCTLR